MALGWGAWTDDDREIARLAVPAFAALVAEPMFLLADTAVVGHLGTSALAALAVAATILQTLVGLCVFLAYATTAAVGRHLGADDLAGALRTGISGMWLAVLLGVTLAAVGIATTGPVVAVFGVDADVAELARTYLSIALLGIPAMLVVLAATGILRGLQDTRTVLWVAVGANLVNIALNVVLVYGLDLGIAGSALGTTLAQAGAAAILVTIVVRAARRHRSPLRPDRRGIAESARASVPLVVRTITLRGALLLGTYVAAGMSTAQTAAYQVALAVVSTLAFALDAVAIAGQAMTGRLLGATDVAGTRRVTARMIRWGWWTGGVAAVGLLLLTPWLPLAFSSDPDVRSYAIGALIVVALVQPVSGVVFVLDGVLIGAGDGAYLAKAGLLTLAAYAPLAFAVQALGAGLVWLWLAYVGLQLARFATLVHRERSEEWLVTGARV